MLLTIYISDFLLEVEVEGFEKILTSIVSSAPFFKNLPTASPLASHPSCNGKPRFFESFFSNF